MAQRSPLAAVLAERLETVTRLASLPPDGRHRVCPRYFEDLVKQAASAIDVGEAAALNTALTQIELLSFELCDD